jgi:hypothetical protein
VAVAAPAVAASGACSLTASLSSLSCKGTNPNNFELVVCFTSTCDGVTNLVLQSASTPTTGAQPVNVFYTLAKNSPQCQQVTVAYDPNLAPTTFDLNTVFRYATGPQVRQSFSVSAPTKSCT